MVPAVRRTGHPFAVSGPGGPSQKIEFVFAASPETIRREPRKLALLRSVGHLRNLAACAPCNPDIFFPTVRQFLSRRRASLFCRNEVLFLGDPRPAGTPTIFRATAKLARFALPFCFSRSWIRASSGLCRGANFAASIRILWICLLRCLESGVRRHLVRGTLLVPAQPAIADGLFR